MAPAPQEAVTCHWHNRPCDLCPPSASCPAFPCHQSLPTCSGLWLSVLRTWSFLNIHRSHNTGSAHIQQNYTNTGFKDPASSSFSILLSVFRYKIKSSQTTHSYKVSWEEKKSQRLLSASTLHSFSCRTL